MPTGPVLLPSGRSTPRLSSLPVAKRLPRIPYARYVNIWGMSLSRRTLLRAGATGLAATLLPGAARGAAGPDWPALAASLDGTVELPGSGWVRQRPAAGRSPLRRHPATRRRALRHRPRRRRGPALRPQVTVAGGPARRRSFVRRRVHQPDRHRPRPAPPGHRGARRRVPDRDDRRRGPAHRRLQPARRARRGRTVRVVRRRGHRRDHPGRRDRHGLFRVRADLRRRGRRGGGDRRRAPPDRGRRPGAGALLGAARRRGRPVRRGHLVAPAHPSPAPVGRSSSPTRGPTRPGSPPAGRPGCPSRRTRPGPRASSGATRAVFVRTHIRGCPGR